MNKSFAWAAALALSTPATSPAQTVLIEKSPKNLRYVGMETSLEFRQINKVEDTKDAVFVAVPEISAKFVDIKSGEEGTMSCKEILSNLMININTNGPKKFRKELERADKDLACPKGPTI